MAAEASRALSLTRRSGRRVSTAKERCRLRAVHRRV